MPEHPPHSAAPSSPPATAPATGLPAPPAPPSLSSAGTAAASTTFDGARRYTTGRAWWLAVVGFILTRCYFGLYFAAGTSDIGVYFDYVVQGVDFGLTPYDRKATPPQFYRDIRSFEYPPVAYWICALPRELSQARMPRSAAEMDVANVSIVDERGRQLSQIEKQEYEYFQLKWRQYYDYAARFRILMLLFDVAGFALFCAILLRRRPDVLYWGMWGYTLSTAFLGYVLFERFDVVLTFALLAWAYCQLRAAEPDARDWAWSALAYTALGFGISLKLIPVIVVPFALLCDLYQLIRTPRRLGLLVGPACLIVAAAGPFAYYYSLVGSDINRMFEYHAERGVQIESSYATLMMLLKPADELFCYFDFGSWNLGGALEQSFATASTLVLFTALAVLGLRSLASPLLEERYDRLASYRMVCVVIPVAALLAKVFSVQYLLWAVPMLLLGAAERFSRRGFIVAVVTVVAACTFTGMLYPYLYLDAMKIHPFSDEFPPPFTLIVVGDRVDATGALTTGLPRTLMILRNVMYGALCAALYYTSLVRRGDSAASVAKPAA